MKCCRACGSTQDVDRPSKLTMEVMGESVPKWLIGLCDACLYDVAAAGERPDGNRRPVTEEDMNQLLVRWLGHIAARVASGKPLVRCEVLKPSWFGEDRFWQCSGWASERVEGRDVCGYCRVKVTRWGQSLRFVGDTTPIPKPFLIWACNAAELLHQASQIANAFAAGKAKAVHDDR